eukprot:9793937-Alexandrium_andersonii.AAC.1
MSSAILDGASRARFGACEVRLMRLENMDTLNEGRPPNWAPLSQFRARASNDRLVACDLPWLYRATMRAMKTAIVRVGGALPCARALRFSDSSDRANERASRYACATAKARARGGPSPAAGSSGSAPISPRGGPSRACCPRPAARCSRR